MWRRTRGLATVLLMTSTTFWGLGARAAEPVAASGESAVLNEALTPQPPKSKGLTLEDAVKIALEEYPASRMADLGHDMAVARLHQAESGWLPRIGVSETWTRGDNPVYVFGSLLEQGRFGPANFDPNFLNNPTSLDNYRLSVNVQYPLFDQLRRLSRISQSKNAAEASSEDRAMARQTLRREMVRAYYGVLVAEAAKRVADEAVATAESGVKSIQERYKTGLVVESDLLAAQVQLAEFRQQQIAAAGSVAIARSALNTMLGRPIGDHVDLATSLEDVKFDAGTVDAAIKAGLAERPDLRSSRLAERNAALQYRMAKGTFLPRVDAFGSFGQSGVTIGQHSSDSIVGIRVSLGVLEPGRLPRLTEARAGRDAAKADRERHEREATVEIVTAWQNLASAEQRVAVANKSVAQAKETARIVRDRYKEGLTTITEDLRAQTALVRAEMNQLAARYDHIVGCADFLRATGRLNDVDQLQ